MLKNATKIRRAHQKATGTHFIHPEKTPTPLVQRAFVAHPVFRKAGDAFPAGALETSTYRSPARVERFLLSGGTSR